MKKFLAILALLTSCAAVVRADDAPPVKTLAEHLEELQIKLDHQARRVNQPTSTGSNVVGLRGSKQEPLSKQLYWKGKSTAAEISPEEVRLFRGAVEQARAGQTSEALTALRSFEEKFPKSALLPEVRETARLLNLSMKTIESHRQRIKGKINLRNGTQLVQFAVNWFVAESAGVRRRRRTM